MEKQILDIQERLSSFWLSESILMFLTGILFFSVLIVFLFKFVAKSEVEEVQRSIKKEVRGTAVIGVISLIGLAIVYPQFKGLNAELVDLKQDYVASLEEEVVEVEGIIHSTKVKNGLCMHEVFESGTDGACYFVKFITDSKVNQVFLKSGNPVQEIDLDLLVTMDVINEENREFLNKQMNLEHYSEQYGINPDRWSFADTIELK